LKASGALLVDYFAAKIASGDAWYAAAASGNIGGFSGGGGTAPTATADSIARWGETAIAQASASAESAFAANSLAKSHATGGIIPNTGMYLMHAGENVSSRSETANSRGGGNTNVTINVTGGVFGDVKEFTRQISRELQKEVRARNGYGWGQG